MNPSMPLYIHLIRDGRDVSVSLVAADTTLVKNVEVAANYWLRSVSQGRLFGAKLDDTRYVEVFYEDLVGKPETVVKCIYNFLGLDFNPEALRFRENLDSLGDAHREIHKNLKKPINKNSIGKWRKKLGDKEQQVVQKRLRDKLLELNYSVD